MYQNWWFFLCIHFNTEDGRKYTFSAYYAFIISRGVKNTTEMQKKKLCCVWGRCCNWSNMSKAVCEVLCWRFLNGRCLWSGRPVGVDSDKMEMLIENNKQSTTQETADLLKISKSIELLMKMKNVFYFTEKNTRTFWPTQCYDELWAVYSNYSKQCSLDLEILQLHTLCEV